MLTANNSNSMQTDLTAARQATNNADNSFLADAARVNMEEIELGRLAQARGFSQEVKDLGTMMVDGHTRSMNELKDLAAQKNVSLPTDITEKGKAAREQLTKADADAFDLLYATTMVEGHRETIAKFAIERDNGTDADVKAWAAKTLPDLQMHLDHSLMVQQKVK